MAQSLEFYGLVSGFSCFIILTQGPSWWHMALLRQDGGQGEGFWEMEGHVAGISF